MGIQTTMSANHYVIAHKFLAKGTCSRILDALREIEFQQALSSFDRKPYNLYQVFDQKKQEPTKLWNEVLQPLDINIRSRLFAGGFDMNKNNVILSSVYIRKYEFGLQNRNQLRIHTDRASTFSVSILLNSEFEGGEFYLYPREKFQELQEQLNNMDAEEKHVWILNQKDIPVIKLELGDLVSFRGEINEVPNFHGILPIKSGSRYAMVWFYERVHK